MPAIAIAGTADMTTCVSLFFPSIRNFVYQIVLHSRLLLHSLSLKSRSYHGRL